MERASVRGALTEEAAQALRSFVAQQRSAADIDDEHFRLVTGFNDIFVVIACLLMLASVAWLGGALAPNAEIFARACPLFVPLAALVVLAFVGVIVYVPFGLSEIT